VLTEKQLGPVIPQSSYPLSFTIQSARWTHATPQLQGFFPGHKAIILN